MTLQLIRSTGIRKRKRFGSGLLYEFKMSENEYKRDEVSD